MTAATMIAEKAQQIHACMHNTAQSLQHAAAQSLAADCQIQHHHKHFSKCGSRIGIPVDEVQVYIV